MKFPKRFQCLSQLLKDQMTYIKNSKEPTKKHTMPKERSSPPTLVAPWIRRQQMIHSLWHFFLGSKFHYTSSFRKILGRLQYAIVLTYLWTYEHEPCWKLPTGFRFCLWSIQEVSNSDNFFTDHEVFFTTDLVKWHAEKWRIQSRIPTWFYMESPK